MAVPRGHLLGDTKLFSFRGLVSKLALGRQKLMFYDIIFVRVSYGAWNKFNY